MFLFFPFPRNNNFMQSLFMISHFLLNAFLLSPGALHYVMYVYMYIYIYTLYTREYIYTTQQEGFLLSCVYIHIPYICICTWINMFVYVVYICIL